MKLLLWKNRKGKTVPILTPAMKIELARASINASFEMFTTAHQSVEGANMVLLEAEAQAIAEKEELAALVKKLENQINTIKTEHAANEALKRQISVFMPNQLTVSE